MKRKLLPLICSRFAIDLSKNSMTPKDRSITTVGGQELSAGDIAKLQASYGCEGTAPPECGGYRTGEGGSITAGGEGRCDWLVRVDPGYAVQLLITSFSVSFITDLLYTFSEQFYKNFKPQIW